MPSFLRKKGYRLIFPVVLVLFTLIFCAKEKKPTSPNTNHQPPQQKNYLLFTMMENGIYNLYGYDSDSDTIIKFTSTLNIGEISYDRTGKKVAFSGSYDIYILELDTREIRRLTNTSAEETSPTFSSTGDSVVFVRRQGTNNYSIIFYDLTNNTETVFLQGTDPIRTPSISKTGNYIAYLGPVLPGIIHIRRISDGEEIYIPSPPRDSNEFEWLHFEDNLMLATLSGMYKILVEDRRYIILLGDETRYSPFAISKDDKYIAYAGTNGLTIYDLTSGEIIEPIPADTSISIRDIAFSPEDSTVAILEYQSPRYIIALVSLVGNKREIVRTENAILRLCW